jgi:DNA-binding NarL/FixJ family response regulator
MSDGRDPIRLVLVDDHAVVRSGLRALLDTEPDLLVVGEAGDRDAALAIVTRVRPDVVLMDLNLGLGPGGAVTTGELVALEHPPRVLVLTTYDTEADILAAIDAGASGYLLKDAPPDEVFRAIRATARGETALAHSVAAALVKRASSPGPLLTSREVQVMELLASGASNSEMAGELMVSVATVKSHLTQIYGKLEVDTRAGAVARAIELRIIRA